MEELPVKLWEAETFRPEDEAFGAGRFMLIIASSLTLHLANNMHDTSL